MVNFSNYLSILDKKILINWLVANIPLDSTANQAKKIHIIYRMSYFLCQKVEIVYIIFNIIFLFKGKSLMLFWKILF